MPIGQNRTPSINYANLQSPGAGPDSDTERAGVGGGGLQGTGIAGNGLGGKNVNPGTDWSAGRMSGVTGTAGAVSSLGQTITPPGVDDSNTEKTAADNAAAMDTKGAGSNQYLDYINELIKHLSGPLDMNDPQVAAILNGASTNAMSAASDRGVQGGMNVATGQQAYLGAAAGLQQQRQQLALQAMQAGGSLDLGNRQFQHGVDTDAYNAAHNGATGTGSTIGGAIGGVLGGVGGFVAGGPMGAAVGAGLGGSLGSGIGGGIGGGTVNYNNYIPANVPTANGMNRG